VDVKTKNEKRLKVKALVDSRCTHTGINEQLVKEKRIQMKLINFSFEVFNADGTKNGEVTRIVPLEIEINSYKEQLKAAVTDLNGTDIFLGHDWLVKHNPEVNWKNGTIKFTRCPEGCTMKHEDIRFKTKRAKAMETTEQDNGEIRKKLDKTNPENLLNIFDLSHTYSTRRSLKSYQKDENRTMKSTLWKKHQRN